MGLYEIIAQLIYAILDIIGIEIILTAMFKVNKKGSIKLRTDNEFQPTSLFVYGVLIISVAYFFLSNRVQDNVISIFVTEGWKTIPLLGAAASFAVFWLTKIMLGRRWDFKMVWMSLVVLVLCLLILFMS